MFLVAVDAEVPPLVVVAGGLEAGQRPVLPGPGVHDRVDQLVPGRLARYRRRLQSRVSAKIFVEKRKNICTLHWRLGAEPAPCGPDTPELLFS